MKPDKLARKLDGRTRFSHLCLTDAEALPGEIWVAWLYGYHLEKYEPRDALARSGPWMHLVLDPSPQAQARAAWMRHPDLRPGAPAPVPWHCTPPGQWPKPWSPPGWPDGYGPTPPPAATTPAAATVPLYVTYPPARLLKTAAVLVTVWILGLLGAWGAEPGVLSAASAVFAILVTACLAGAALGARARRRADLETPTSQSEEHH
ncbi:hypothetical protein [Streptomyces sp. NRRL B-24484]|uniref:hypothetical protein n=1 Tax=Streptomyces sp. NRRL B-24484 TaxID=1463833 RepID=UPI0004C1861E|nr:hypothetical protein [Streptomyces sp. NRRL B-24484]